MADKYYLVNIFAFIIALLIYFDISKFKGNSFSNKIYLKIVIINLVLIVVDVLADVFNELPGSVFRYLNIGSNALLYILAILPVLIWLAYTDYFIFHDAARIKKLNRLIMVMFLFNAVFTVLSLFDSRLYFTVDTNNVYIRGPLFWLHMAINYAIYFYTTVLTLLNKSTIDKRTFRTMLFFPIPMVTGNLLQVIFYGLLLTSPAMLLSTLIIYFTILDSMLNTDYLTGVSNRRSLDLLLKNKIKNSQRYKQHFAVILLDMDNFKQINDSFGHHMGDEALIETVKILKSRIRSSDVIVRLGGDEFYVIMDVENEKELSMIIFDITQTKEQFNQTSGKPYKINFSMGYELYTPELNLNEDNFIRHIDRLMYAEKAKSKNNRESVITAAKKANN